MKTYVIRREKAWQSSEELEAAAGRSKQVAESDFPDAIRWIRSYVIDEPGGTLGTVCIYQASGPEVYTLSLHDALPISSSACSPTRW